MTQEIDPARGSGAYTVEVIPEKPAMGAEITLQASAPGDLTGQMLLIRDAAGEEVGRLAFTEFDGEMSRTDPILAAAPNSVGRHLWEARPADGAEDLAVGFELDVTPHRPDLVLWDIPPTVQRQARFRIKAGVRCFGGCSPTGWTLAIEDHEGRSLANASLGAATAPGTSGLHVIEIELAAPEIEGLHSWQARITPEAEAEIPHEARSISFRVRVVPAPEVLLRVEAWDNDAGGPLSHAKVVAHPYRTVTDGDGIAELELPKGNYTLFVSGRNHIPYRHSISVDGDTTIRAELYKDQELSAADLWA